MHYLKYKIHTSFEYTQITILKLLPMIYKLKSKNIKNIRTYKYNHWHLGYAYFTGIYKKQKVFIKFDTKLKLLENDILAYKILKKELKDHLIEILDYSLEKKMQFIIYKFEDMRNLSILELIKNPKLLQDISKILSTFEKYKLVHRDFRLENLFITNNTLKIIDFTFTISKLYKNFKELDTSKKYNCKILRWLGTQFLKPNMYTWDDYYSITQILKNFTNENCSLSNEQLKILRAYIKNFEKKIGKITYEIKCT